jgi:very-short-patch-repair endonuclease
MCESPAEKDFLCAAYDHIEGLVPQYLVPGYRLDFAVPDKQIAIEIDGHEYHKTKEQRTHDAKRERELSIDGWRVVRFTASEIWQNATSCVDDVLRLIGYYEAIKTDHKDIEIDTKDDPSSKKCV